MQQSVIDLPPPPVLPVVGEMGVFPVRRVFCVGRNYAAHAREMGVDPAKNPPFFFMKPADAVLHDGTVAYPPRTADYHHEVELVVALASGGRDLDPETARFCIYGYGVGLDLTRRDVQNALKAEGKSWEMGKCAEQSAPVSALVAAARVGYLARGAIRLEVNGELRQSGDLADMILPVAEVVSALSTWFTLRPGDLIFTGTPEGVGPVYPGDRLLASIEGVGELAIGVR